MKGIKGKPILLFILVLAALYCVIYVIPTLTGALRSSYTVEYGELQISDETDGYIVRNEKIYFAGTGGEENRYISAGKLIRKGTKVMTLTGSNDDREQRRYRRIRENVGNAGITTSSFAAQAEGVVSYYADGYEAEFTPSDIDKKKYDDFRELGKAESIDLARSKVAKGDPVFKIVDRSGWYLVCYVPLENRSRYKTGERYTLVLNQKTEIYGRVTGVNREEGRLKLVIRTDYYYKNFASVRTVPVKIITSDATGLVIYNSSITKKNGRKGVYVRQNNGKYRFTPVQVITTDGKKSVISSSSFYDSDGNAVSTVQNYDEVLRRA
ncbi:HlyD family efflux transporter periplasmic adaptor subunit [Hornefia butyriciproducens]|uniref:HlyD family efflux transporter periplasmic adaptor subunit n=1 Tax=Hornefia butyriciproducens TaxID=2652293 RepID=UPI0029FD452C|nr:HlyD family efflux transporter periplasmic adaptor subunit [Hornefia butyriciproducens]MDD7019463.1 HlyD family efflux transporter periplasmic adaptor subunit [Hornefia butyriciproducens]MDY5462833.1 HlyD family efflux transporter periplasmic adaptor subunit [Hornefia butyriciproducens]